MSFRRQGRAVVATLAACALGFTGFFVLIAIATGLLAVWHVRTQPRGQRLQTLGTASRSAASAIRARAGTRRGRRGG